ncbi:Putative LOC101740088, partial [Caligus rogercresseyi]
GPIYSPFVQASLGSENNLPNEEPLAGAESNTNFYRASVIPVDLFKYNEKTPYQPYKDYGYDSQVHRSPYDSHNVYDAHRTRDRDYK